MLVLVADSRLRGPRTARYQQEGYFDPELRKVSTQ